MSNAAIPFYAPAINKNCVSIMQSRSNLRVLLLVVTQVLSVETSWSDGARRSYNSMMQVFLIFALTTVTALDTSFWMTTSDDPKNLRRAFSKLKNDTNIFNTEILLSIFIPGDNVVIEEIIKIASEQLPVSCVASSDEDARNLWPLVDATTHTLLIYIYRSHNLTDFMKLEDISYLLLHNGAKPKILFITILEQRNQNFQSLLEHMWDNKILDVIILDISSISSNITWMIHQYNPFTKIYNIQPLSFDIEWFPDKLRDMNGYPIKMDMVFRLGFNTVERNSQGDVTKFDGPDAWTMNALKTTMNFTVETYQRESGYVSYRIVNHTIPNLLSTVQEGVVDVSMGTVTFGTGIRNELSPTQGYTSEKWCVLMPVLYEERNSLFRNILGMSFSLLIVSLFWVASFLLKFRSKSWQALNIFGMIMIISLSKFRITTIPERIVFAAVVIVGSIYSSSLYTHLTLTNINSKVERPINTFRDLSRTDLVPIFYEELFNVTFKGANDDLMNLKPFIKQVDFGFDCGHYLITHMNVCCLIDLNSAFLYIFDSRHYPHSEIMVNEKLCFWTPPNGFYLNKYSPYQKRFSEIILKTQEAGIRHKWYMDYFSMKSPVITTRTRRRHVQYSKDATVRYQITRIIGYGYFISFIAFIAEVLIHKLKRN